MAFLEQHATIAQAASFFRAGDIERAESTCRKLLKRNKRDVDALQLRGAIAVKRRDYDEAAKHYARCLVIRPRKAHFHFLVGKVAALQGRYEEALRKLDKALTLQPDSEPASEWKAMVLQWDGRYDEARAILEPFVSAGAETAGMAETQALVDVHDERYGDAVRDAARHLARPDLPPDTRHRLGHVAGNAYEKMGDYDNAFAAHTDANRVVAVGFDRAAYARFIDGLIEVFSRELIAGHSRDGNPSQLPMFIAGMPRSGTTLVEQIIDAHPNAFGAGELNDIVLMVNGLQMELGSTEPWPACAADFEAEDVGRLARRYLDRVRRLGRSAKRTVDKSLENYRNLGLIAVLFPRARIIHCHRDLRDTCLSCYMSGILPGPHPYVSDLGDLGFAYRQYERLMAHWRAVLPQPILDVGYETLVDDLEGETRRIIDFCGLGWDDRCLRFHTSGRIVRTASYEQVRRPLYRTSIGRWKNYERHLGPLLEALGAASKNDRIAES